MGNRGCRQVHRTSGDITFRQHPGDFMILPCSASPGPPTSQEHVLRFRSGPSLLHDGCRPPQADPPGVCPETTGIQKPTFEKQRTEECTRAMCTNVVMRCAVPAEHVGCSNQLLSVRLRYTRHRSSAWSTRGLEHGSFRGTSASEHGRSGSTPLRDGVALHAFGRRLVR